MAALDYLRRAGLTVETVADRLRVSPADRITDTMRQFIREHRSELAANDPLTPQQIGWLAAVASLLEVGTGQLLEWGFIDRHDLGEQHDVDPRQVAALIKSDPRWYQS